MSAGVLVLAALFSGTGAHAQTTPAPAELQDASRLLRAGQHAQALERVNQVLAQKPKDAQARFLKGLILAEQNKTGEAIDIFARLTQDYPELPEPYNNLAVLYASQGQYEKARQSLEMSIRTHPAYATAYENLGDVYAKLASQAYDKALQLDSSNSGAQSKLSLIRDLISGGRPPVKPGAPAAPARTSAAEPAKPTATAKPAPAVVAQVPAQASAPAAAPANSGGEKKAAGGEGREEVLKTVRGWASAWAAKDVDGYLSYYAKDFKTPKGEPRNEWAEERRVRISAPKKIEVSVESPNARIDGDTATVTFRQNYRSNTLKASSTKTLSLVRSGGRWLIREERVGS